MSWEEVLSLSLFKVIFNSLAMMELRLVLSHFAYLFDAHLLSTTDPGYCYTVVVHPGPVYAILVPTTSKEGS